MIDKNDDLNATDRLALARRLDLELCAIAKRTNQDNVRLAYLLLEIAEKGLARSLGHSSVGEYAEKRLGFSRSKTKQFIAIARDLERPELEPLTRVAEAGQLEWTKIRVVGGAANE